jgi:ribonuclease HI
MNNNTRRIVLYVDGSGSQKTSSKGRSLPIGWGVVALHDDTHHEIVKGEYPRTGEEGALFETYAFIEGIQYAVEQGFSPEQISIYTDDERLSNGAFQLHPQNYAGTHRISSLTARLKLAS